MDRYVDAVLGTVAVAISTFLAIGLAQFADSPEGVKDPAGRVAAIDASSMCAFMALLIGFFTICEWIGIIRHLRREQAAKEPGHD